MRVQSAVALGIFLLAMVLPGVLAAQQDYLCDQEIRFGKPRRFAWEFSPYVAYKWFDQDGDALEMDDQEAWGARLGFNWTRHWETEVSYELTPNLSTKGNALTSIDAHAIDVNMVFNMNTAEKQYPNRGRWIYSDRWTPYFTFGLGHASYNFDGADTDEEFTLNVGGGTRVMLGRTVGLRFDARARLLQDDADIAEFPLSIGATWIMGGKTIRDSDADGVLEFQDRCPGTPQGCIVDCFGCEMDEDGDGVCDGVDRCPETPAGCFVDAWGCPLDSDEDGVCDGLDNCPDTPKGCWVDAHGCERDTDGDGVCDGLDRCPGTPECCKVDRAGCPLDGDADGVCDGCDECPKTPRGDKVDKRGCTILKLVLSDVYFEFNKAVIRDFYYPFLNEVARSLKADNNLSVVLELEGHTDSIGTVRFNYALAERRAKAVKEYLVSKRIHPNRLVASTRGEGQPIRDNATAEGRRHNRRVEMHARGPVVKPSQIKHYRIVLRNVYFDYNKSDLKDAYKPFLTEVARAMKERRFGKVQIALHGLADHRGSAGYNVELSKKRAESVKQFLASQGLSARRIEIDPIGNRGATGRTATAMQEDRRVEVHTK